MAIINYLGDFLLNEWIWSLTYGFYQVPLNTIIMFVIIKWVAELSFVRAITISALANILSFFFFHFFFVSIFVLFLGFEYVPSTMIDQPIPNVLHTTLWLGVIYASLQIIFFGLVSWRYKIHFGQLAWIAIISNALSCLIAYLFLPVF